MGIDASTDDRKMQRMRGCLLASWRSLCFVLCQDERMGKGTKDADRNEGVMGEMDQLGHKA